MKQQNIKRLIREEVQRAVRYEVGRAMKRMRVVVIADDIDPIADTEPVPLLDLQPSAACPEPCN